MDLPPLYLIIGFIMHPPYFIEPANVIHIRMCVRLYYTLNIDEIQPELNPNSPPEVTL